jgi:hypothetical protein
MALKEAILAVVTCKTDSHIIKDSRMQTTLIILVNTLDNLIHP